MEEFDTYKTLKKPSEEILLKEKNSKFFAQAFPVNSEAEILIILEQIRKRHPKAGHYCYAWQLGKTEEEIHFRSNDDGEPSNSAGMPIYGQIQSFEVTNVFVVVTRYFGGVKLGVGGLIQAYKSSAKSALEISEIANKTINLRFEIVFDYPDINSVMRLIRENDLEIIEQILELDCRIIISVRKRDAISVTEKFNSLHKINFQEKKA